MKPTTIRLVRMGNSRGICLPAKLIAKHKLELGVILEERGDEIVLRTQKAPEKLSWKETAEEMAASGEDWSHWESSRNGRDDV